MRVRFTTDARTDLDQIFRYLADDSVPAADAVFRRLHDAGRQLSDAPRRYPVVLRRSKSEVRRRPVGSYNVYFRIEGSGVEIVRVVHAARDTAQLFPEN